MYKPYELEIIRLLVEQKNYMSAQEIAEKLHISRRTVFNKMELVKTICAKHHTQLIAQKAKGFRIDHTYELSLYLKGHDTRYMQATHLESKLYIAYLLLNEDEKIHISELEEILYLSRPTIYKLIHEVEEWFRQTDIELTMDHKGISIRYGERRYRQALKNWIAETTRLFNKKQEKRDDSDFFKLKKILQGYLCESEAKLKTSVEKVCEECKIHCSLQEIENMAVLLNVMIYRNQQGFFVQISNRLLKIINDLYPMSKIERVTHILFDELHIRFAPNEIIYLITNVLINGDFKDRRILNERVLHIEIKPQLMNEITAYLLSELNIDQEHMNEIIQEIRYIIKREIIFSIKGNMGTGVWHYDLSAQNFHATVDMARDIFQLISKYYFIIYQEKLIYNLIFLLLYTIQKCKRNLRIVLLHNCDEFEYKYVIENIKRYPFASLIYSTDKISDYVDFAQHHRVDLLLSTIHYHDDVSKVLEISKVFGRKESVGIFDVLNQMYEDVNFREIIKNRACGNEDEHKNESEQSKS